jgi:hypothetical protein
VKGTNYRALLRNFLIEMVIYAALVVGYFFVVLRILGEPLRRLFGQNLVWYAFVALGLIVAQAVALEFVTSFLMKKLGLELLE